MGIDRTAPQTPTATDELTAMRQSEAAEDLAAIKEDWGAVWNDFDQIRMDADFDF